MAKDPAFLFYPGDFLTGTLFMSNEQVGKYVRLLCAQHQHGGIIDSTSFNEVVGDGKVVRSKFIECDGGFYNERMSNEMIIRSKKSSNISDAAKKTWALRKNTIVIQSYNDSSTTVIPPENRDSISVLTVKTSKNGEKSKDGFSGNFKARGEEVMAKRLREGIEAINKAGGVDGGGEE